MSITKKFLATLFLGIAGLPTAHADDIGVDIPAASFYTESSPSDPSVIRDMGNKVGYVRTNQGSTEYWSYVGRDFETTATHVTVRASSATNGGTLYIRAATPWNPTTTLATVEISNTGGWDSFQDFTVEIDQDAFDRFANGRLLFFVVEDNGDDGFLFDVESFRFDNLDSVDEGVTINGGDYDLESYPSDDDIVRRIGSTVGYITDGSYIRFIDQDVGFLPTSVSVRASSATAGGTVYVTSQAPYGFGATTLIAAVDIDYTGGWDAFEEFTVDLESPVDGIVGNLYFTFEGGDGYLFDIESFQFKFMGN